MTRDIDDVIHPASDLIITVGVPSSNHEMSHSDSKKNLENELPDCPVTSEVKTSERTEVCVKVAIVTSVNGARHPWPRPLDAQSTCHVVTVQFLTFVVQDGRSDAEHGPHGHSGHNLRIGSRRTRAYADSARFRLPPGVDYGALALADRRVVPVPRFHVDRLTNGSQSSQGAEIVFIHVVAAVFNQQPDGRRCAVELVHFKPLDRFPVSTCQKSKWVNSIGSVIQVNPSTRQRGCTTLFGHIP